MRPVHETRLPWEERGITFIGDPHTFKTADLTEQLRRDLQAAKDRGDLIAIWGDIAEWILPSDIKRYNNAKHNSGVNAAINKEVGRLADFYAPFADSIEVMKLGNHETSVIKYHHVDPMAMLIDRLNQKKSNGMIFYGGYTMWWLVKMTDYSDSGTRTAGQNVKFFLHHGVGGGAPVTRGAIDRARVFDAVENADVVVTGHKHQSMHVTFKREALDDYGNVRRLDRDFLILAGYSGWEQTAPDLDDGYILDWAAEKHYGLESTGCKRVVLTPVKHGGRANVIRRRIEGESS